MKVTDEMIIAYQKADICSCHPGDEIGTRIQAVFDLIDPVPELVNEVVDSDGDRWRRTIDPLVWQRGHQKHSIGFIDKLYGPITWEGKAGE